MADSDYFRENGYGFLVNGEDDVPSDWGADKKKGNMPESIGKDDKVGKGVIRNCMLRFSCPLKWESLELTNDANVRYCGECTRPVHYCHTPDELHKALSEDKCVALKIVSGPQNDEEEFMGF